MFDISEYNLLPLHSFTYQLVGLCLVFCKYFSYLILYAFVGNPKGSKATAPAKTEPQKAVPPIEVPALSLDELKEKTDNFGSEALIGEGSYGRVYYATLNSGQAVAVKKLDVSSEPETNVEFLTQASIGC